MKKERVPKFHMLRIYITSTVLYFFLVLPFVVFLVIQYLPETRAVKIKNDKAQNAERDTTQLKTPAFTPGMRFQTPEMEADRARRNRVSKNDSTPSHIKRDSTKPIIRDGQKSVTVKLNRFFNLFFLGLLISFILGFAFNRPCKLYLKRKRRHKAVGEFLETYGKRFLLFSPIINIVILLLPHLLSHIYGFSVLLSLDESRGVMGRKLFPNFFYVSIISAILTLLFVYFWQKNRLHLKYIDFFYSKEDLQKRIFWFNTGKIGRQLGLASVITTFFPLAIVMLYFLFSLTPLKELQLESWTLEQRKILLGNWDDSVGLLTDSVDAKQFEDFFYITAVDALVMCAGIGTGILISIIYIFLLVKWTTRSIVDPVNELLANMKKIRKDGVTDYTIVRTNDEVGELAEGFNSMIGKIKNYIASISQMNAELENKVIERTREIEAQKEEIETQKEEIESQLERVTEQKNTIEGQKTQILDSIHYAKRIQTAILPPTDALKKILSDYFVLYKPRDIVSGDFYWTFAKDDKLYIALADCTGHGVPGAFLSILGISYLNEIISENSARTSGEILGKLRDTLIYSLHQKGVEGETQDGMEVALCILNLSENTLQYSGANRPLYLVRKNSPQLDYGTTDNVVVFENEGYQMLKYKPDNMPIGIYSESIRPFSETTISLLKNDSIYLFTDGYVDQMGGPKRKTFKVKYFRDLLFSIQDKQMSEQQTILEKHIHQWKGALEQTDDMLVLAFKV